MNPQLDQAADIRAGVRDAWDFWLSQHDISIPDLMALAMREAVTAWLDDHGDDLLGGGRRRDG